MSTIESLGVELQKEMIILQTCNEDFSLMHTHPFFEFVYVLDGRAEHTINDHTMILSKGDYFLIDMNCRHEYRKLSGESDFCIVNCMFLPSFIDVSLRHAKRFEELAAHIMNGFCQRKESSIALSSYHDQDGFVGALVQRMMKENKEKKAGSYEMLRASLVALIVCLAKNETATGDTGTEYIIRYIRNYVDENYYKPLGLTEICRPLNFSLTYISLTFKREMGMTFRDYLKKVRLEKACGYLRTTEMSVAEISDLVGYSDAAFLYKIFKKELGVTPNKYRELQKR